MFSDDSLFHFPTHGEENHAKNRAIGDNKLIEVIISVKSVQFVESEITSGSDENIKVQRLSSGKIHDILLVSFILRSSDALVMELPYVDVATTSPF